MKFIDSKKPYLVLMLLGFGLFIVGCGESGDQHAVNDAMHEEMSATMGTHYPVSEEDYNKLVVMEYMEAYSTSLLPEVSVELLSPDYELIRAEFANMDYHAAGSQLADMADPMNEAIANRRDLVDMYIADGDMVVVRYQIRGTHAGNFYGIPGTGTEVDVLAGAMFWLEDGKITKSWHMADEAGFLIQVGEQLPARADGRWEAWPFVLPTQTGDEIMEAALANPIDSQEYLNKLQVNAWKSPAYKEQVLLADQSQRTGLRSGFLNIVARAPLDLRTEYPFGPAFPGRVDHIAMLASDGKRAAILFRLTATNSVSLVGLPAQDRPIAAYEFGFHEFDGEVWKFNMWFGDDLGMLLQIGGPQDHWFQTESE